MSDNMMVYAPSATVHVKRASDLAKAIQEMGESEFYFLDLLLLADATAHPAAVLLAFRKGIETINTTHSGAEPRQLSRALLEIAATKIVEEADVPVILDYIRKGLKQ